MFPGLGAVSVDLHVPVRNRSGYVSRDESALIAGLAKWKDPAVIFEFGTFDGLTTLNIAKNVGRGTRICTLDLPVGAEEKHPNDTINRQFVDAPDKNRYRDAAAAIADVTFLAGDSATFDFSPYRGRCDFIFVDASPTPSAEGVGGHRGCPRSLSRRDFQGDGRLQPGTASAAAHRADR